MQVVSRNEPKVQLDLKKQKEVARKVDLMAIHSLNILMWHRTETSFLLVKRTLAEAPAPCKRGWGKGLMVAMAHLELAPRGAGVHKRSLMTRAKQHTDPPGKTSSLPGLALG